MGRNMEELDTSRWSSKRLMKHHLLGLKLAINEAVKLAEAEYRSKHTACGGLSVFPDIKVYRTKPTGFAKMPVTVVSMFLQSQQYLSQTNDVIVANLSNTWAPFPVSKNAMSKEFTKTQSTAIQKALESAGKSVDVAKFNTLTKVKKALRAHQLGANTGRRYQAEVIFSDTAVTIGGRALVVTIHEKGYARIRLNRNWLRCDELEALFKLP